MIISRDCAVCGSSKKKTVYSQRLEVPTIGSIPGGNDVVVCSECGFAYADNLPDQTALDQHYRHSCDSSEEAKRYDASEQAIIQFLRRGDRILDIGCGSGQRLCRIKDQGYGDVVGLEPSEAACVAAREQHGLNVVQGSLFDPLVASTSSFSATCWSTSLTLSASCARFAACCPMVGIRLSPWLTIFSS
jgi:SAM-dependent methyltransferase